MSPNKILLGTDNIMLLSFLMVCGFAEQWMCVRVRWKWVVFGMRTEYVMYENCLVIECFMREQ